MVEIKNTIGFSFPNGSAKPTMDEMVIFAKTLDANIGDINTMYRISEEKSIFVKFNSEASVHYALVHNPEQVTFHYENGNTVQVRISVAGGNVQYVRIFDLPPEVPDKDLSLVLGKYGKVKRVIREKFPAELGLDVYTGVRGVYMDVEKEIPSSLKFSHRKGNIFYSGNKDKCFLCKAEGHRMNSCPKRKDRKQPEKQKQDEERKQDEKKRDQDDNLDTSSYAGVVAGASTSKMIEVVDEEVMAIDEMTPDSEENSKEVTISQVQKRHYRKYPAYLVAKSSLNPALSREKAISKQSSSRKK